MIMRAKMAYASATALVIEDDDVIAHLMRLLLQREGYAASHATDRSSVQACLANCAPPQLITLDWKLRDVNGLAVLQWIRSTPRWEDVPVLIVTGLSAGERDLAQVLKWDRVSYIRKPFDVDELYDAIRDVTADGVASHPGRAPSSQTLEEYACRH